MDGSSLGRCVRMGVGLHVLAGLAGGVAAQQVYRSTGPDGRAVFSDHPPPDREALPLRRGSATLPAPGSNAALAAAAIPPHTPLPELPELEALRQALAALVHAEQVVTAAVDLCSVARPASAASYSASGQRWRERHAPLLTRRDAILQQGLAPRQRAEVVDAARADTRRIMDPGLRADAARRGAWCERRAADIDAGRLDRHHDAAVVVPLMAWQAPVR